MFTKHERARHGELPDGLGPARTGPSSGMPWPIFLNNSQFPNSLDKNDLGLRVSPFPRHAS